MAVDPARAKSLFLAASDLSDAAERAVYLDRECGADAELRDRVEALLRANDALPLPPAGSPLTADLSAAGCPPTGDLPAEGNTAPFGFDPVVTVDLPGRGEHVGAILGGKYKLIEEIGQGGMGSVFMAQQTEPVKRAVAVKVIKAGMDSNAVLARFEAERQALAMMDHPNIARVLDAGTTESGRPYFVMELVKGKPITQYCDERRLTPRQRLELFVPVCQAMQHAHQKGVIHRDIKPSNVLVAMYDDRPVPKVIDFGVAKAAGQSLTDKTLMTGFGAIVGTPEYMSPEQANLNNLDIDTRSDVYSLGVLLYELLTGTTPVDKKSLGKAAILEILRIVREVEAPRPSAKLSSIDTLPSVAANRGTEPARLSRLVKGELDWIVMKALEKDRTRRYETASAFAADVRRHLAEEPVEAGPPGAAYRLRKFVKRNRGKVLMATALLLTLLAGITGTSWGLVEALAQHEQADRARNEESRQRQSAYDEAVARAKAEEKARLAAEAQEKAAGRSAQLLAAELAFEKGTQHLQNGATGPGLLWLARALETAPADAGDLQDSLRLLLGGWTRPLQPLQAILPAQFEGFSGQPIIIMPGGKTVINLIYDGAPPGSFVLRFWDKTTGKDVVHGKSVPWIWLPDPAGEMQETLPNPLVAVSENGKWILASQIDLQDRQHETVRLYDFATCFATRKHVGQPLKHSQFIRAMTCSADGKKVRTVTTDLLIHEWDVESGRQIGKTQLKTEPNGDPVALDAAIFSDDGKTLVTAIRVTNVSKTPLSPSTNAVIRWETTLWDPTTGKRLGKPLTRVSGERQVRHNLVALSPDVKTVLTQYSDGVAVLWNIADADNPQLLNQLSNDLTSAAFSPDSKAVLAINAEGVHLYETTNGQHVGLCLAASRIAVAAFSPDGQSIQGVSTDHVVHTWQFRPLSPICLGPENCSVITISPSGRTILYDHANKAVRVWDAQTGAWFGKPCLLDATLAFGDGAANSPSKFVLSPDGNRLVVAPANDSDIHVWDVESGTLLRKHAPGAGNSGSFVALSPDGKKFGLLKWQQPPVESQARIEWVDVATGEVTVTQLVLEPNKVGSTWGWATHPSGGILIWQTVLDSRTTTGQTTVAFYDWETGMRKALQRIQEHGWDYAGRWLVAVGLSPDGKMLLMRNQQWDMHLLKPMTLEPLGNSVSVPNLQDWSFSPDSTRLLITANETRVWNLDTRKPVGEPLRVGECPVLRAFFCPSEKWMVTTHRPAKSIVSDCFHRGCTENLLQIWDARSGKPVSALWRIPMRGVAATNLERASCLTGGKSLLIAGLDQQAQVWQMPTALAGNLERIRVWIETLTSTELDSGGAVVDLDAQTWNERYGRLQKLGGPAVP